MGTEESNQKTSDLIVKAIELIVKLTTLDAVPPAEFRLDPVGASLRVFEAHISNDPIVAGWFNSLFQPKSEEDTNTVENEHDTDSRVRYAKVLTIIYDRLTTTLTLLRRDKNSDDEYTLLSVQQIATISGSIQFFLLTQCLPYIEEGVGLAVQKRSQFIKTWRRLTSDIDFQREQLASGLATFKSLIESNDAMKTEILNKYIPDIISCYEQRVHLGPISEDLQTFYDELLEEVPKTMQISVMMGLIRKSDPMVNPPQWFTKSLGRKLSTILISENGLRHTLDAYLEMSGDQFWDNTFLLNFVGKQFAIPPFNHKKLNYYSNIVGQLMELASTSRYPEKGFGCLFGIFADEFHKRNPNKCGLYLLDPLFKPWELMIAFQSKTVEWTKDLTNALSTLAMWSDPKLCPNIISRSTRLAEILPMFLCLLASTANAEDPPPCFQILEAKIKKYLLYAIQRVTNKGEFLMNFVRDQGDGNFQFLYTREKKKLVVVVGEEEESNAVQYFVQYLPEDTLEVAAMARLEAIIQLINCMDKNEGAKLIIDLLCESVSSWACNENEEELPRFIEFEGRKVNNEWIQFTSHLVATFCFEQLNGFDINGTDSAVMESILKFVKIVLYSCRHSFDDLKRIENEFDVVNAEQNGPNSKVFQMRVTSAKMALGLATTIITAGVFTEEAMDIFEDVTKELVMFSEIETDNVGLRAVIEQTKVLLQMLGLIDENAPPSCMPLLRAAHQKEMREKKRENPCVEIRKCLASDLIPLKGHGLLRIAQCIRRKEKEVIAEIEKWILTDVRKHLEHPDSYIYMNAINALAEITNYDPPKYLRLMLNIFAGEESKKNMTSDEEHVDRMMRSHIADAIGKVFRVIGDIGPKWLPEASNVFINGMKDSHDVTRASSLSAFSDLILACRGRGVEKYFAEVSHIVMRCIQEPEESLVRRSAILLLRQYIRSCDSALLEIFGDTLRDIRRTLVWIWKNDGDHVMRLHAQLCCDQIQECMEANIEESLSKSIKKISIE